MGRRDQLADDIVKQSGLDTPGVGMALMHLAQMRQWGVQITPEVAKACIAQYVESAARIDEVQAQARADRAARKAVPASPAPWAGRPIPEERILPPDRVSLVYYAQVGDRVKIGFTTNLVERMSAIVPEKLLAVEHGGPKLERARHKQFAALRTQREWFRFEPPLTEHVANLMSTSRRDELMDTATAAVAFGVKAATIRKWAERGRLVPVAQGRNNRSMYRRGDIEDLHARLLDEE